MFKPRQSDLGVFAKAIELFGKDMQLNVAIEELSELAKEICKNKRGRDNRDAIIEEMADCYIMLEQMIIMFDIGEIELYGKINEKTNRLEKTVFQFDEGAKISKTEKQEWISVAERLPEKSGNYIVCCNDEHFPHDEGIWFDKDVIVVAEYYKGGWTWNNNGFEYDLEGMVTHWMPFPEAPKGETK